ncbi:MAG: aminotransferase class I/II-fold pyridoxal phosphate-dependent enzyme [Bacteroidales bacterium]|jgi:aspartate/methionine/tyrosine aminotransferase|nr:aminotransferase class I/II-fold pyridoxal phosphate-dependent enzyme [Bacteroidales bacterium]
MRIKDFKLERYFARYEFSAPYLLSCSDCEPLGLQELLSLADQDTLTRWSHLKLGYTESQGQPVLREEVAGLYQTISPDDILIAAPEECIFIAMNCLLEKGDHIITTFPGYQSLYEVARAIGCEISRWTQEEQDGFSFNIHKLKDLIREQTKLVVINFPHNPTGATLKENDLREILDLAGSRNIMVFSDEMYRFLEHHPSDRIAPACDLYNNAVSLSGMSKSFALAGLRIGWLATQNENLLRKFLAFKDYTTICNSAPSEILALGALRAKEQIISRNLEIIHSNLGILDRFFSRFNHLFTWSKPKAGPIAYPTLDRTIAVDTFCNELVEKKGVMLLPSSVYDDPGNHFRIGFARNNMPEALALLQEYLHETYG